MQPTAANLNLDKEEIKKALMFLLVLLEKNKMIPKLDPAERENIVNNVADKLEKGGIKLTAENLQNKDTIKVLSTALVTATLAEKNAVNNPDEKNALNEVLTLMFKPQDKLQPEERKKLTFGLAYVAVMEKNILDAMEKNAELDLEDNPKLNLAFKALEGNPPKEELEKLSQDLEKVFNNLKDQKGNRLDPKLDLEKVMEAIKVKLKLKKMDDPSKDPEAELKQSLTGIGTGPLLTLVGNLVGVANNAPIVTLTPQVQFGGQLLDDTQAYTGVEALAAGQDLAIEPGEPMVDSILGIETEHYDNVIDTVTEVLSSVQKTPDKKTDLLEDAITEQLDELSNQEALENSSMHNPFNTRRGPTPHK